MEGEAYEYYDQDDQGVYQQYQEDQNEEYEQEYPEYNSQNAYQGEEVGHSVTKNSERGNTKLYKSIVKRYGPEETGSGSKKGSPYKQARQDQSQSKFSFHPEINEIPKEIYNNAGRKTEISKEEQWDRLLKPKTGTLQERERLKHQKEAQEIQENCTFQPTVNKNYQLTSTKYAENDHQFVSDRLYAEGMEKMKSKEMTKRRDDADACTFQPDVGESVAYLKGEKLAQRPIHERLGEIMKQKQEFLQKLRMNAELTNKDTVFKPAVNEHSQILANAKQQVRDVTERLMRDAADKVYKKMRQNEELESQLTTLCTFKPNVNPISKSNDDYLATNDLYTVEKDVVTRQYIMADIQRENLQKRAAEIISQEGCTFVPKINKISQFLIEADPQRTNENIQEKMDRLSKKDAQKKEIFQEQMQKAHYEQFKFQPEINKISKEIGKKANLDELAYNRGAKEHLMILREKSIDNMLSACTFKPEVNRHKKYEAVEPLYRDEEQIMDNVKILNKKKEIKYDQQRKIEEYNEMKECTFKPRIKGEIPEEALRPKLASSVAGLDKFIQMRERHKKQQEDKKKREEEVFGIHKKYSAAKHEGFTTAEPFKLSKGSKHSIRNTKVIQELREQMTKDYTFKPVTNEGKNREIINNMISYGSRMEA